MKTIGSFFRAVAAAGSVLCASVSYADELSGVSTLSRSSMISPKISHLSVGLGAESLGGDLGLGPSVTTPFFLDQSVAVRVVFTEFSSHNQDLSHFVEGALKPYSMLRLGPVFAFPTFKDKFRLSVASGVAYDFQCLTYSKGSAALNLKGFFALEAEYLPRGLPDLGVFLDLGAMQASHADKFDPSLEYAYGFDASLGLRHYF